MSSVLQLPSKLVQKFLKVQNAAGLKLLMNKCSMVSPELKMQAASPDIQP